MIFEIVFLTPHRSLYAAISSVDDIDNRVSLSRYAQENYCILVNIIRVLAFLSLCYVSCLLKS
jgi:hypothetical protein